MPLFLTLFFKQIWDFVKQIPLKYIILAIAFAVTNIVSYNTGYNKAETKYQKQIEEYANRQKEKEIVFREGQTKIETKIVTQYVERVKYIEVRTHDNHDVAIDTVPAQYQLSNGWVYTHDAAVKNELADKEKAADPTPSDVKDNEALGTVINNYGACEANKEQLKALQEWVRLTKENVEKANKK